MKRKDVIATVEKVVARLLETKPKSPLRPAGDTREEGIKAARAAIVEAFEWKGGSG